eukprot:801846-Amphidinium_carterae.2
MASSSSGLLSSKFKGFYEGSFASFTAKENFAARWTGGLRISTGGTYTFAVSSNDGSVLMVRVRQIKPLWPVEGCSDS